MPIYSNPQGLYDFQAGLTAYCILRQGNLAVVDAGLGKTHIALATASFLFEDDKIDHALFVVEGNKLDEWVEDFENFTQLTVNVFWGPKRTLNLDSNVTLTTYQTMRDSLVDVDPADDRKLTLTSLAGEMAGKNILAVFDEAAILGGSRSSRVFRAYEMALDAWRDSGADVRVLGLTATPMSSSPENYYNLARIIAPELAMSVTDFNAWYVAEFNQWHKPKRFKNLEHLEQTLSPMMLRKRKTDPDVIDQFPKQVEKFVTVHLHPAHQKAYEHFDDWIKQLPEEEQLPAFAALNAFVCHPRTVLMTEWETAREWAEEYGISKVEKLKSAKAESVIGWVESIVNQADGSGVLVFCKSVNALKCLAEDIGKRFPFVEFHGGQSDTANKEAKAAFRAGQAKVMLASSKAERGINLPEATYIVNFDAPLTHASYIQRLNRGSRIGSNTDGTLVVKTFIAKNTIEKATINLWQNRNQWSDTMQDTDVDPDSAFVSAAMRKVMISLAHKEEHSDS